MEEYSIETKILNFLGEHKGSKYSIKEIAKSIGEENNYTWVIRKCQMLHKQEVIEIAEEIITSSQGNRLLSKQVWIK